LHRSKLTSDGLALLQAIVEHCCDGLTIWSAVPRLAAYSKLSERKVQRLIHGEERDGRHHPDFAIGAFSLNSRLQTPPSAGLRFTA